MNALKSRECTGDIVMGFVCRCSIRLEEDDLPFEVTSLSLFLDLLFSPGIQKL